MPNEYRHLLIDVLFYRQGSLTLLNLSWTILKYHFLKLIIVLPHIFVHINTS